MKTVIVVAGIVFGLAVSQSGLTQGLPTCASSVSDKDGDGYGWENNQSCVVEIVQGSCEDRGDYPWGWNTSTETSCRLDNVVGDPSANATNSDAVVDCVDTDGDGWGWNESTRSSCLIEATTLEPIEATACIDSDGDGWGWNGSETCSLDVETQTVTGKDLKWRACGVSAIIDDGMIMGTDFLQSSGYPVACIRQCSEGVNTVALPEYPGWGYDNQLGMQCVITSDLVEYDDDHGGYVDDYERYGVPVYVAANAAYEQPQRLVFEDQLLHPLYAAGGVWECSEQSRDGIDQLFSDNGNTQYFQFMNIPFEDRSELRIWNTNPGVSPDNYETGTWSVSWLGPNYITEAAYLNLVGASSAHIGGYMLLDGGNLALYANPFSRQNCQLSDPVEPVNLPGSLEQVEALSSLTLNQLLNRPLLCTAFEKRTSKGTLSPVTNSNNDTFDTTPIEVSVQYVGTDESGDDRYQLSDSTDTSQHPGWADIWDAYYKVSEDNVFSTGYASAIARTSVSKSVEFKQFGQSIIRVDGRSTSWQESLDVKTLYHCY